MNKKLLLLLADHLKTIDPKDYTMSAYGRDALFFATQVPEIKKAGLHTITRVNDNGKKEPGGVTVKYRNATDVDAAADLFDIDSVHARYLFGDVEIDIWGNPQKSYCESKREKGTSRDTEWPAWTAARIIAYVKHPDRDFLGREAKEAA